MAAADVDETRLLNPNLLQVLESLYVTRSVTRTAEQLGQTQSTISILLARLRKQLDDPLFVRTPEGMQPTPRIDDLIPLVREILDRLRHISAAEPRFDPALSQREFRISMTDASHITILPRLFSHVRSLAPQVRLEAVPINPSMVQALQSGECDLAIGLLPTLEAGFYRQTLYSQDWLCLANPNHPRIGPRFTLKHYLGENHVAISSGTGAQVDESLRRQRRQRKVALTLSGFLGLGGIISTTDLIATLPRHIGETLAQTAGLRVLECPISLPAVSVNQYWHARYNNDPANRWLRGICAQLYQSI
ncbi:LysR family transcriptional regulator [Pseudomonas frederiksbergensis]|uniref:LysR family transcriptional regulator n=1 Tax=Pseudomonas frederiksbergensis TaxID=104087 RepID=UPI003D24B7F5